MLSSSTCPRAHAFVNWGLLVLLTERFTSTTTFQPIASAAGQWLTCPGHYWCLRRTIIIRNRSCLTGWNMDSAKKNKKTGTRRLPGKAAPRKAKNTNTGSCFLPAASSCSSPRYILAILVCRAFCGTISLSRTRVRLFAAVSLKQGVIRSGTLRVSGMPFFADVQAAVLYPSTLC